jgi:hypothetical protein
MLAMKEKNITKERQEHAADERQTKNTSVNTREEDAERNSNRQDKRNMSDINNRARKSYHNDGPGGNYPGF